MRYKDAFCFVDLFSGIGGFRIGLENNGGICVGYSEISKNALKVYKDNFKTEGEIEIGDITKFDNRVECDIVVGGVPCQSWSSAGLKRGFDDDRGRLWLDTIKFVENNQPKGFIFENVKGLADPRNKDSLLYIINNFERIGYKVEYKLINAFEHGIPQNRERIFIVGIRKDKLIKTFEFPENKKFIYNLNTYLCLSNDKDKKYKLPVKSRGHQLANSSNKGNFYTLSDIRDGDNCIHSWDILVTTERQKDICLLLLKNRRKKLYGKKDGNPLTLAQFKYLKKDITKKELNELVKMKILKKIGIKYDFYNSKNSSGIDGVYRLYLPNSLVFPTITKTGGKDFIVTKTPKDLSKINVIKEVLFKKNYRAITVKEANHLQSFPKKMKFNVNDDVAFGLLGNAVPVLVVEKIMKKLIESIDLSDKDNIS